MPISGPQSQNLLNGSQPLNSAADPNTVDLPDLTDLLKSSQNQNPPTSGSGSQGASKSSGGRNYKFDKLRGSLQEQIAGLGMLLYLIPKTQADGQVVMEHAETLAARLVDCAKENEQMYKALVFLVTGTVWTALGMEVAAIVGALLKNHGVNPLDIFKKKAANGDDQLSDVSLAA